MDKEVIKREFVFEAEILLRKQNFDIESSQNSVERFQEELTGVLQQILLKNAVDYDNMSDLIEFIQPTILDYLDKLIE